jgi:hypothetical protein
VARATLRHRHTSLLRQHVLQAPCPLRVCFAMLAFPCKTLNTHHCPSLMCQPASPCRPLPFACLLLLHASALPQMHCTQHPLLPPAYPASPPHRVGPLPFACLFDYACIPMQNTQHTPPPQPILAARLSLCAPTLCMFVLLCLPPQSTILLLYPTAAPNILPARLTLSPSMAKGNSNTGCCPSDRSLQ